MLLRATTTCCLLAVTAPLLGCGEEAPPPPPERFDYTLDVKVFDVNDNPLPKAPVTVDGKVVGHTDADGKFSAVLNELEGQSVTLAVLPVPGYRYQIDSDSVTEVLKTARVSSEKSGVPIFLNTIAESMKKDYFVWFKAGCENNCGGWPVLLNGKQVGKTNDLGYAHFSFNEQPNNDVEVEVSTPKGLTPASPRYTISLDDDSTAYRIEQPFEDPNKPKPRPRPAASSKSSSKTKKPSKPVPGKDDFVDPTPPPDDGGGINLF